jgi:F-type H+-transporting ATPase subunit delta
MKAKPKQLADALLAATEGKSGQALADTVRGFLEWMHGAGQLHRAREVMRAVDAAWKRRYGVARVAVESAHALPVKVQQAVDKLAKGADVSFSVDPSLIGGARMRVDDLVLDNTVLGRAERLEQELLRAT